MSEQFEKIRACGLDFLFQFGGRNLELETLDLARLGLWTFLHDYEQRVLGRPPCFWEMRHSSPVTRASLLRLTSDGCTCLYNGIFKTLKNSYVRTLDSVLLGSTDWAARASKDIMRGTDSIVSDPCQRHSPSGLRRPAAVTLLQMLLKGTIAHTVSLLSFLAREEEWRVGITFAPIETYIAGTLAGEVQWLPRQPEGNFYADPFGCVVEDSLYILAEEYESVSEKGHIVALKCTLGGAVIESSKVMAGPFHMSYPCLFSYGGKNFCVPETSEVGSVSLYEALDFPHSWRQVCVLLHDINAGDPTMFQYDGIWWLFCSVARRPGPMERRAVVDTYLKLHAWYADSPYGPWIAHPANPLKTDICSGRPAGAPFFHEGKLYRPAQDGSLGYGGAIVINHVTRLTKLEFSEDPVNMLTALPEWKYRQGIHTLNGVGLVTLFDAKRVVFSPRGLRRRLVKASQEIRRRMR